MAIRYREVRPRRATKNPSAMKILLIAGGVIGASLLLIRYGTKKAAAASLPPAPAAPIKAELGRYKMQGVDCVDLVAGGKVVDVGLCGAKVAAQLEGVGGIFSGRRGMGSL